MDNLWPRLEPLLARAERPARYIDHEFGAVHRTGTDGTSFAMVYPDTYELGQANQAVRILVNAVNAMPGAFAERVFLPAPEFGDLMRKEGLPLFSIEGCAPVAQFDVVGITVPHELAVSNVLETLDLAGIPLRAADRAEGDPIVVAGGPCTYNPEPFCAFFDAVSIGEGEESIPQIVAAVGRGRAAGKARTQILEDLADIPGTYIPAFYEELDEAQAKACGFCVRPVNPHAPQVVKKRVFSGFSQASGWEPCVVPYVDLVHDRLNVEVLRGCARGCRFCQAGMIYRPVRERSAENVVDAVERGLAATGYDEVSLTSLSSTDHSQIERILTTLNRDVAGRGIRVSVPSQRLDAFGAHMAELVAGEKRGGLTFAPEAGTQRLRDVINKNVTEDNLFGALDAAFRAGWTGCKLYFMVGLPTETDEDVLGIADLGERCLDLARSVVPKKQWGRINITIAISLFVPKTQTPFQWDGQVPADEALRRVNLVRDAVRSRQVNVRWHSPQTSLFEALISRGGRECADLIEGAWRHGARFDAWWEYFDSQVWLDAAAAAGIDADAAARRSIAVGDPLPWGHISPGVSDAYLRRERERAAAGITTPDCTFAGCTGCGLCPDLGVENVVQEARHG